MSFFRKTDPTLPWRQPSYRPKNKWYLLFFASVQFLFAGYYLYWCTHLPAPGKAVLVIGLVAVFMALDMAKPLKAACLVLVFALAFLESKSIDRDRFDATIREAKLLGIAQTTATAATQTLTNVVLLGNRLDTFRDEIRKAETSHDTNRVMQLQAAKDATEKQIMLALAPGVIKELRHWWDACNRLDDVLQNQFREHINRDLPSDEQVRLADEAQKKRIATVEGCTNTALPAMASGNYIRDGLLHDIPISQQSDYDKKLAAIFVKAVAGEPIQFMELNAAANYLESLSKRFSPSALSQ